MEDYRTIEKKVHIGNPGSCLSPCMNSPEEGTGYFWEKPIPLDEPLYFLHLQGRMFLS